MVNWRALRTSSFIMIAMNVVLAVVNFCNEEYEVILANVIALAANLYTIYICNKNIERWERVR